MAYSPFPVIPSSTGGGGGLGPNTVGTAEIIDGSIVSIDIDSVDVAKVSGIDERVRDVMGAALVAGTGVAFSVNDAGDTITASLTAAARRKVIVWKVTHPTGDALTVGDGLGGDRFVVPAEYNGWTIVAVDAGVTTASSSGNPTIQLARIRSGSPTDVCSTRPVIDANELTSYTGTTGVVNSSNATIATGDVWRADVDVAGTGAYGLHLFVSLEP